MLGSYCASEPRVSTVLDIIRWLTKRCWMTTAASAIAASAAALSPVDQWSMRLFGTASWSCGAPGFSAASASVTTGSGSYVTVIASSASNACWRVSATTTATWSPTNRTRSFARRLWPPGTIPDGCGGKWLSTSLGTQTTGIGMSPAMSSAVNTPTTPGMALARAVSIPLMSACARSLNRMAAWSVPAGVMSPTYSASPRTRPGPSLVSSATPMPSSTGAAAAPGPAGAAAGAAPPAGGAPSAGAPAVRMAAAAVCTALTAFW